MQLNLHSTGASFAKDSGPRDLIVSLVEDNPGADRKELFEKFARSLNKKSKDYRRAIEWYFFVNMYEYLTGSRHRQRDPVQLAEVRQANRNAIEQIKAKIVMLDLVMPNGKTIRDCTGHEMASFGTRFKKVAARVGKVNSVGSVLSEDELQKLMK